MSDTIVVNLSTFPEDITVNLSTTVESVSTNLVETTLAFLGGAGVNLENTFTQDNTFEQDITVLGTISASQYLGLPSGDYLPLSGGTITGNLSVTNNLNVSGVTTIPHISGNTALSGNLTITGNNSIIGNLSVTGSASVDNITFDQTPELAGGVGVLRWNDADGTLDLGLKGGNVTLQLGQEEIIRVVNKTNANLLESQYKVVRIRTAAEGGAQGQRLAVVLAQADNDLDSVTTLGVVTEDIGNNQEGFITMQGVVRGINTTGTLQGETWVDGDVLYLSPTVAGRLTKVKPQAPQHVVTVGYVEYAHQNNGKIFVKIDNGYKLDELHNVRITNPTNGQLLTYNLSTELWENKTANFLPLTGGSINGSISASGTVTASNLIYNTGDQAISGSLSASGNLFSSKLGLARTTLPAGVTLGVGPNIINDSNLPVQYSSSTAINYIGLNAQGSGYGALVGYTQSEFGGGLILRTVPAGDGINNITFVTQGNTERMRIVGNSGNVGIGTSTANERLTVSGNISATGGINSQLANIVSPTSVGSGTVVSISGTATNGTLLKVQGAAGGGGSIFTATNNSGVGIRVSETGQLYAPSTASFSGQGGANIALGGGNNENRFSSGNSGAHTATDFVFRAGTADRTAGRLFQIQNFTAPVLTVSASSGGGNVGIGTDSPTQRLTVSGNISASGSLSASNITTTSGTTTIGGSSLAFNTDGFSYGDNLKRIAHRTALGAGAVGDTIFTAGTQAAVHGAIGIFPMSVVEYTSGSGSIALPADARFVSFELVGGGGGGGSGCRQAAGTARSGGTGGRGGSRVVIPQLPVSRFTWPLTYSVGAGGFGAASILVDNTNGSIGQNGGTTQITNGTSTFAAIGGQGGFAGVLNAGAAGAPAAVAASGIISSIALVTNSGSGSSSPSGIPTPAADVSVYVGGSGGAGGGITNLNVVLGSARATNIGSTNVFYILGGLAGTAGSEVGKIGNSNPITRTGTGGGGGMAVAGTFAGSAGGDGALYGGGGGGGSASVNGQPSGKGGNGAGGIIIVTFYY